MTPLDYFGGSEIDGGRWSLDLPRAIHGAFGGVTGGALAAAAVALGRTAAPGRTAVGLDVNFLRGLASETAVARVEVLNAGRVLTVVRTELADADGRPCTVARTAHADAAGLDTGVEVTAATPSALADLIGLAERARPWRTPAGVDAPIIDTVEPRAARVGDGIATVVTAPWEPVADGAEAACLVADLSVGPPVDAALPRGEWIPHPNPDLSLRFSGPVTSSELTAVAICDHVHAGVATVSVKVWEKDRPVASGVSTSLLLRRST